MKKPLSTLALGTAMVLSWTYLVLRFILPPYGLGITLILTIAISPLITLLLILWENS